MCDMVKRHVVYIASETNKAHGNQDSRLGLFVMCWGVEYSQDATRTNYVSSLTYGHLDLMGSICTCIDDASLAAQRSISQ